MEIFFYKILEPLTKNVPQFYQGQLECKRFMFLMRYFIIIATVAMITEIVSFFFYIATTVKETNSFVPSPIP